MAEHDQDSPMPDRTPDEHNQGPTTTGVAVVQDQELSAEHHEIPSRASSVRSAPNSNYEAPAAVENSSSGSWDTAASSSSGESPKDAAPADAVTWFPITEDSTLASPTEIAQIEALGESSALDEKHWIAKFGDLNDPEYAISDQGSLGFTIKPFNGTQQNPKKNYVYTSEPVRIGGYVWTLKLFPKGLEGPYLAVNLECKKEALAGGTQSSEIGNETEKDDHLSLANVSQPSALPWRCPAQFHIVIYNPEEPRVHINKGSSQSFGAKSPTHSFKRFASVNIMDIGLRFPHQRQALLRNDTLAIKAYVRTYHDETGCLFWRGTEQWDNLSITGFRGLHMNGYGTKYNQSLLAAVATWLFLPSLRKTLQKVSEIHNADRSLISTPLLSYLFDMSCAMTRSDSPEDPNCDVGEIDCALSWHGADAKESADVFEIWELLIGVVREELKMLPSQFGHDELSVLGFARLAPVYDTTKSLNDVQGLISRLENETPDINRTSNDKVGDRTSKLRVLNIQLPRQRFDAEKRRWKKSRRTYELNESIHYKGSSYKLHAIILHDDGVLTGRSFSTFVRADGKNFYRYGPDYRRVVRLTKQQTFTSTQASAYAVVYVLDEDFQTGYQRGVESTNSKSEEIERVDIEKDIPLPRPVHLTFLDSRAFTDSNHPGFVDQYNLREEYTFQTTLTTTCDARLLNTRLRSRFLANGDENNICYVWEFDDGLSRFRPALTKADLRPEVVCSRRIDYGIFWVHIGEREHLERLNSGENEASSDTSGEALEDADKTEPDTEQVQDSSNVTSTDDKPQDSLEDTTMTDAVEEPASRIATLEPENMCSTCVFVKYFEPKRQILKGVCSFICPRTATLPSSIRENVPGLFAKDGEYLFFEERSLNCEDRLVSGAHKLNEASTAEHHGGEGLIVVIVQPALTADEKDQMALEGGIVEVSDFVAYMFAKQFGMVEEGGSGQVLTRDYFGSTWYQGTFSRGKPHGEGREVTLSGEEYVGAFKMGLRNGKGLLRQHNNNTYEGDFWDGQPHGTGKHVEVMTGNTYTGGFKRGKKRGRGTTEWQQAQEEVQVCRICYENEQDCAFYPCGHVCACLECARQTSACPMCHKEGARPFKLYFSR